MPTRDEVDLLVVTHGGMVFTFGFEKLQSRSEWHVQHKNFNVQKLVVASAFSQTVDSGKCCYRD